MKKQITLTSLIMEQRVLSILLMTLVVITVWVGFSIYFSYKKTSISPSDAVRIEPLSPKLDSALFSKLKARKTWNANELASFSIHNISLTTAPTPTPFIPPSVATESGRVATSSATP